MVIASYIHALDGRLRIKVPQIKRSTREAFHVEAIISSLDGVTSVKANPTTGNILIHYDSNLLTHADLISHLKRSGYLRPSDVIQEPISSTSFLDNVGHAIARSVTEALMERAILALL